MFPSEQKRLEQLSVLKEEVETQALFWFGSSKLYCAASTARELQRSLAGNDAAVEGSASCMVAVSYRPRWDRVITKAC